MQQPVNGGFIKLFRTIVNNGHLQMPDQAFKLFIYLLLRVNHAAAAGCQPGEGWITYDMIRERCSDAKRGLMPNSSISRSLRYLEREGYVKRLQSKRGAPQRIRIVNWDKYQGESGIEEIQPMIQPALQPVIQPMIHKQEEPRTKRTPRTKEGDAPNGESPAAKEPQFPPEASELVNALWNYLQVREALPPTPKGRTAWRMSNLHYATRQMLDPSTGKTVKDWLACLEWAGAQPFWANKVTNLAKLTSIWPEYQMQSKAAERGGGQRPSGLQGKNSTVHLKRDKPTYDLSHINNPFGDEKTP